MNTMTINMLRLSLYRYYFHHYSVIYMSNMTIVMLHLLSLETRLGYVVLGSLLSPAHGVTVRER